MTDAKSTIVGLKAELKAKRKTADRNDANCITRIAASEDADAQWGELCAMHRRQVVRLLTKILARPYEWFLQVPGHSENQRWTEYDYIVTNVDGVWITFLGCPSERLWLLQRVSDCQPDCPPNGGGPRGAGIFVCVPSLLEETSLEPPRFVDSGAGPDGIVSDVIRIISSARAGVPAPKRPAEGLTWTVEGDDCSFDIGLCIVQIGLDMPASAGERYDYQTSGYSYLN